MNLGKILVKTGKNFTGDNPMNYSSSIAFYTIFSLPAILLIILEIAGSAYEAQVVQETLMGQIRQLVGLESVSIIEKIIDNYNAIGSNPWTKVVGFGTLIFSATTVFISLQNALNEIWNVKPQPKLGILKFFTNRLISLAMVFSLGFLLLVSLMIDTILAIFKNYIEEILNSGSVYIVGSINLLFTLSIITLVFALIFKFLPDVQIQWRDVWTGAILTTLLFITGKYLISFYLSNSSFSSAYGAAGSLVIILIWVYYSSLIVLFGAEFTYVYSKERGHLIKPNAYAVKVEEVEKENGIVNKSV